VDFYFYCFYLVFRGLEAAFLKGCGGLNASKAKLNASKAKLNASKAKLMRQFQLMTQFVINVSKYY